MRRISKLTVARLLLSGALVGIALGNLLGVQLSPAVLAGLSEMIAPDVVSGVVGATVAAVAFKLVHIL